MPPELSVIIPTYGRSAKLRTLLEGIAATEDDHDAFEVIVVVDGHDEAPLEAASTLPATIRFQGLTKVHAGPAAARNFAIEHACGDWLVFFDDDLRVDEHTIPGHLRLIRDDPNAVQAHLGRADWPHELLDSPWRQLLAETSMLFFWDHMTSGKHYGFRHFWTLNLSVRRDCVLQVGGFREQFPWAMHEDIELGWRLQESLGLQVHVDRSIQSFHDHALDPHDYLLREHKSGKSAGAARTINPAFHDLVWPWIDDPVHQLTTLQQLFLTPARDVLRLFHAWAEPSDHRLTPHELHTAYLAHMPMKRMVFLHGYLDRPFEALWYQLHVD